jgi:acyl carrier protein
VNTEVVVERVIELAADIFGTSSDDLTARSTPADVESWDSVAQLNLIVAVEDEFSIQFTTDDIERAGSIGAIAELVAERSA